VTRRFPVALAALTLCCGRPAEGERWIAVAREAHQAADDALARGDAAGAREALRRVVELRAPEAVAPDDRRAVLQDAFFRLAYVELDQARPAAALDWAEMGLRQRSVDVFTANLLLARGRALEALGDGARAAADYYDALRIHDELLQRALEER